MKSRAIVFSAIDRVELVEFEQRQPRAGEVMIKVEASCVSPGTELRCLAGKEANASAFPFIPGYAPAGTVVAVGDGVTVPVGCRVVCNGTREAGHLNWSWGGHCEYAICPEGEVSPIPDQVGFEQAAAAVVMGIPVRGVRLAAPMTGETVAVIGLGLIGNFSARIFSSTEAVVHAFDLNVDRVNAACDAGVDAHLINGSLDEAVRRFLPDGADVVVDCTGSLAVTGPAMELGKSPAWSDNAGPGARFVFQGSLAGNVSFPYHTAFNREMKIIFPRDRRREDVRHGLMLLASGKVKINQRDLLSLSVRECGKGYRMLTAPDFNHLSVVFRWD